MKSHANLNKLIFFKSRLVIIVFFVVISATIILMSLINFNNKFAGCFDFKANFIEIFNYESRSNEISCLYGLKCQLILVISVGHSIYFRLLNSDDESESFKKFKNFGGVSIVESFLCMVELFFVISAILLTTSILSDFKR